MTRRALLVLGMHRSGTSALTGLLERLGARGPRTRMPPDESNPFGYGESPAISDFNEQLLGAAGTIWDSWTPITSDLSDSADAQVTAEWRSLIDREFSDAQLFVVKDPRISRLVPYWLRLCAAHSIEPAAVIALRSPYEVASSLAVRNSIRLEEALLMWLRHVLDAERETRQIRRSFVRYTDVLSDWRRVAGKMGADLALEWPDRSEASDLEITQFLTPELRHHAALGVPIPVDGTVHDWTTMTEKILDGLADRPGNGEAFKALDAVRRDLDRAAAAAGPAFDALRSDLEAERTAGRERARTIEALQAQISTIEALRAEISRLELEYARIRQHASAVEQRADSLEHALGETQRHADSLTRDSHETRSRVNNLEHDLGEARRRIDELIASASWRVTAPLRAIWEILRGGKP